MDLHLHKRVQGNGTVFRGGKFPAGDEAAANHTYTQRVLRGIATAATARATAILDSAENRTGASHIMLFPGDTDYHIHLYDAHNHAAAIEFAGGRNAVAPLRRAFGEVFYL